MDLSRMLITDAPAMARSPHAAADVHTALCEAGHDVALLSVTFEAQSKGTIAPDKAHAPDKVASGSGACGARLLRFEVTLNGTRVDCQRTARAWSIARIDANKRKMTATRLDAVQRRCVASFFDRSTKQVVSADELYKAVLARGWMAAWRTPDETVDAFASRVLGRPLKTHALAPTPYVNVRALVDAMTTVASADV